MPEALVGGLAILALAAEPLAGPDLELDPRVASGRTPASTRTGSIESHVDVQRVADVVDDLLDARELEPQRLALAQRVHLRRLRRVDDRAAAGLRERQQLERHAVDVDVLRLREIGVVGAPQAAADDLLAEELALERAQAEDLGHVPRVPALREHRDRDQAAHLLARLPGLADGRRRPRGSARPRPAADSASSRASASPSSFESIRIVTCFAVWFTQLRAGLAALGDVLLEQLGHLRLVADDDHHRRDRLARRRCQRLNVSSHSPESCFSGPSTSVR